MGTDVSEIQAAQSVKVMGSDSAGAETTPVGSTTLGDMKTADVPNQQGLSTILNLNGTAIVGKVGASVLTNRKYIEMQALTTNVKWGYDANCPFDLFKNQFFALPMGAGCNIYFKAATGTAQVAFAEK